MANAVTFELRADDKATPTVQRAGSAVIAQTQAVERAVGETTRHTAAVATNTSVTARHTAAVTTNTTAASQAERQQRRLDTAIGNVTTSTGLAAGAVTRMSSVVLGLAQGAVIGAVAALTAKVAEQAIVWLNLETAASRAEKTIAGFGRTMAQSVAPALLPIQTRIEEINKQLGNINARTPEAAAAIESRLIAERENLTRLRDAIRGPEKKELTPQEKQQEVFGANIQAKAAVEYREKQELLLAKSTFEIEYAKIESDAAALRARTAGEIQEQRGRQILDARRKEMAEEEALIVAKSTFEIEYARVTAENERAILAVRAAQAQATMQGQLQALGTMAGLSASKSKALFLIGKAAAVAQSIVSAHAASAMALASPPGPPVTIPLAATVLKWGYANAALAAAVQMATGGFSGGGGGGSIGGTSVVSSVPSSAREIGPGASRETRHVVDLTVKVENGVFVDERAKVSMAHEIAPALGRYLKENGFVLGDVTLEGARL